MRASLFVFACLLAQQALADECPAEAECDGNYLVVCANGMISRLDCTTNGATWKCGKLSERFGNGCYEPETRPPCGDVTAEAKCDGNTLKRCVTDTTTVNGELIETGDHLETEDCPNECGKISEEIGDGCYPTADFKPCGDVTRAGSCDGNKMVYCDWNPETNNVEGLVTWPCGEGQVCSTAGGEAECVLAEDAGAVDGGAAEDGGAVDGGAAEDGGAAPDGGAEEDAGTVEDAGSAEDGGAAEDAGSAEDGGAASGQDAGTGDGGSSGGSEEPAAQDSGSSDSGSSDSGSSDSGVVTPGADAGDEESDDDGDDGCSAQPGQTSGFLGALSLIALFGLRRRKRA